MGALFHGAFPRLNAATLLTDSTESLTAAAAHRAPCVQLLAALIGHGIIVGGMVYESRAVDTWVDAARAAESPSCSLQPPYAQLERARAGIVELAVVMAVLIAGAPHWLAATLAVKHTRRSKDEAARRGVPALAGDLTSQQAVGCRSILSRRAGREQLHHVALCVARRCLCSLLGSHS